MKKHPWVPIACFILTLGVSYVAGVSGKAAPLAACHDRLNHRETASDELLINLSPALELPASTYSRLHQAYELEFYTLRAMKTKPAAEIFLAAATKAFGPVPVTMELIGVPVECELSWIGLGSHFVGCCHTTDAGVNCEIPLTWRFDPINPQVSAAGTAFMSGTAESIFSVESTAACPSSQPYLKVNTTVEFTVTYSKPGGKPAKTTGRGSTTSSTNDVQAPPVDISDNKLSSSDTLPLSHKLSTSSPFDYFSILSHEVPTCTVRASADSAVRALAEIKFRTKEIHLNDNVDGKNDKTNLGK